MPPSLKIKLSLLKRLKKSAGTYTFFHISSKPLFPQSNMEVEQAIKMLRQALVKFPDPYLVHSLAFNSSHKWIPKVAGEAKGRKGAFCDGKPQVAEVLNQIYSEIILANRLSKKLKARKLQTRTVILVLIQPH